MDEHAPPHRYASARGGARRSGAGGDDALLRPLTSVGSAELDLPSTQARALLSGGSGTTGGAFDVRQFLLDQKGDQPFHQSSLFRAPPLRQAAGATSQGISHSHSHSHSRVASPASSPGRKTRLPRMETLAQSAGALPRPLEPPNNRPEEEEEEEEGGRRSSASRFYTLERMADSCYHAVQSRNKTWLFLPGAEERSKGAPRGGGGGLAGGERPARRADVLDLLRCYDAALAFAAKKRARDVECSDRLAMVDRDLAAIQTRVGDKYASGSDADHQALARLLFEQKWSDVVLGELEAMLTASFLEQGAALRKARIQYAQAFSRLEELYAGQWGALREAREALERLRADARRADDQHAESARAMKDAYAAETARLAASVEASRADMDRRVGESREQMSKMGDTMRTLNAIFRQMREDTEKVKAVELRESLARLELKHEQASEELARLRPLVELNQALRAQLDARERERDKFRDDMAQLDVLLAAKDETIASLMEQQSDLLAAQELREAKEEEMRKRAAEDEEEEEEEEQQEQQDDDAAAVDERVTHADKPEDGARASAAPPPRARRTRRLNSSAVCMRCKQELRALSAKGSLSESAATRPSADGSGRSADESGGGGSSSSNTGSNQLQMKRKRVQCLYFRILLPNLRGRRPQREPAWTLSCMRAILFAKQVDDAMCRRSGGAFPSRVRMPEFVYAWFSPWRAIKDEKLEAEYGAASASEAKQPSADGDGDDDVDADDSPEDGQLLRSLLSAEQRQMLADEDRWSLYYGVKALVQQGYLEAKLFLSLLDEKFGEDELVFMLYCYQLLDVLVGGKLHWGPLRDKVAYHVFSREFELLFGPRAASSAPSTASTAPVKPPVVPKTIWISPYHASLATSVVLARATEAEREALDRKMMAYVVTNVPDEERPRVFLTPEQVGAAAGPPAGKKLRRRHDADDSDDEREPPPQFIDAHLWVELMMLEYKEEQAHRRAAIRLMFQTATLSAASGDLGSLPGAWRTPTPSAAAGATSAGATMDMEQFRVMVRTLNDETPAFVVATLFRDAYARGQGVVTFDAFMDAAEAGQFFSTCMRLESPAACLARLASGLHKARGRPPPAAASPILTAVATSSRAAFLVDKLFAILRLELAATVAALPLWVRSVADALAYEVSSLLHGSDARAAFSDGVRLLAAFHRLVDYLQLAKLVKREVTGEAVSSKQILGVEKALQALVDSVRQRDKSTAELLVDAVKQKLCVKRVQLAFRAHLRREEGAPLAMRALMHRDYGRVLCASPSVAVPRSGAAASLPSFRSRQAVRPTPWLLAVVALVFRASLKSHRVPALLTELSSVSSALGGSSAQHALDSPSAELARSNGGIGPAPRPVLLELLYDLFIDKFGTRWEAEKVLHDLFVTCRAAVSRDAPPDGGHPAADPGAGGRHLARLFGYVCCMDALPALPESGSAGGDDRLLGQNEAVAFVQAVLRCNLHPFALLDPALEPVRPPDEDASDEPALTGDERGRGPDASEWRWPSDRMPAATAEKILAIAFVKRGADETQRMRARVLALADANAGGDGSGDGLVDAGAFLVLALHEWRRYVLLRMGEVRAACHALDGDELEHFARALPLETVASVLQKAGVTFSGDELGTVFRRLLATEPPPCTTAAAAGQTRSGRPAPTPEATKARLSERVAAASFPLLAREPLAGLLELEDAAPTPFKVEPNARLSLELLRHSWRAYERPSRALMDQLRHVGKSNDIQAEAFSRAGAASQAASQQRSVLYLSSSTAGSLSSQDVAQLEAVHALFLDRLAAASRVVSAAEAGHDADGAAHPASASDGPKAGAFLSRSRSTRPHRSSSVAVSRRDGSMTLLDDEAMRENAVNEAWKVLRQLLVGLAKLRALAGLGTGALPDALDGGERSADGATTSA